MTTTFNTDLKIFENTLREELPGRVIRIKGNHIDDPGERQFDSIKTQEEFVRKATEESKRLQQEMVDSEAESIMPPD